MKKINALMLCLLMVVSLVACGSQENTDKNDASTEQVETTASTTEETESTETATPTTEETEQTEESTETVETEPVETEPAFDTGWAGEEYEMPIPEPPFTQYSVQDMGGMFMIQSTSTDELAQLTEEDIITYCDYLKECLNFTNIQVEKHYENDYGEAKYGFGAETDDGLVVELDYGAGGGSGDAEPGCVIIVVCPQE